MKSFNYGYLLMAIIVFSCTPLKKYADTAGPWEKEIRDLEVLDQQEQYSDHAILFVGSSSIRLWKNIHEDMAPYEAIRRGYGGAHFADLIHFTGRLVAPHQVDAVVCFVANDISGSDQDLNPREVLKLFQFFVHQVREIKPQTPLFLIEITPTNSRWSVWPQIREANRLMKDYCLKEPNLYFIETAAHYLGADGKPKSELFISDQLHMNQSGYDIWKGLIKEELNQVLHPG